MAHRRHMSQDSAAIFSPSVARIAASNARNWSYVEAWLASKLPGRPLPPIERNPDTLRVLLALASLNEAADDERQLILRAEQAALHQVDHEAQALEKRLDLRGQILDVIEDELPREGQIALDAISEMAVQEGLAFPETEALGRSIISNQKSIHDAEQMVGRLEILRCYIERDTARVDEHAQRLDMSDYQPPTEMAKRNLDMQRRVKELSSQLTDLQDRVATAASIQEEPNLTVKEVSLEECEYLALLSQKKQLDFQLATFEGLPSDPDLARSELDALRRQLRGATTHRDAVFEGLVERESPIKNRRLSRGF